MVAIGHYIEHQNSGVVLGLLLTVKALAGDFTLHKSYILFVYYFATWILMGSTWGFARLFFVLQFDNH